MIKVLTNFGGTIRDFSAEDVYEFKEKFENWYKDIYLPVILAETLMLDKDIKKTKDIDVSKGFFYKDKSISDAVFFSPNKLDKKPEDMEEIHSDNLDELQKALFS